MSKPREVAMICSGSHDKHCPHLCRHCHIHMPADYERYDPCGEHECMVLLENGAIGVYTRKVRCVPCVYKDGLHKPSRPAIICDEYLPVELRWNLKETKP